MTLRHSAKGAVRSVFLKNLESFVRASRGYDVFEVSEALTQALLAFKMHLRGWRTHYWHLPSTDGRTHDGAVKLWSDSDVRMVGTTSSRPKHGGWQPNRHGTSWGFWPKSIWRAVAFVERKAGRVRQ